MICRIVALIAPKSNDGTPKSAGANGASDWNVYGFAAPPRLVVTRFTTPVPVGIPACVAAQLTESHTLNIAVVSPGTSGCPLQPAFPYTARQAAVVFKEG